jgi:hypothetical protein
MSSEREIRDRCGEEAARLAHRGSYAPRCNCGKRMYKDNFNGMWVCHESGHGGYQTQDQVARLIYNELMESEGILP